MPSYSKKRFHPHPLAAALLGFSAIVMCPTGVAYASPPPTAESASKRLDFNIPAQNLTDALDQFSAQSGYQIIYDAKQAAGLSSPGVSGQYEAQEALQRLTRGSLKSYSQPNASSFVLDLGKADQSSVELGPLNISGSAAGSTSAGSLIASQSRVGTKTDTPLMETPQSISVVTRKQMDEQKPQSIGAALRYTAGVNAEANGVDTRRDTIGIRGFDATTGGGIYRDGLRQFSFSNQSRAVGEVYGLDSIEVLRGPSSVLYGQGAPSGMVNIVTKRPTDTPIHEITAQYGSYDRKQIAADVGGPLDDEGVFSYRLTGLFRDSDTQIEYAKDDRQYIAPAFTWRPSDATSLTVLTSFQKDRNVLGYYALPRVGTLVRSPYGRLPTDLFVGDPDYDKYDVEQWSVGYQLEHQFDETWTFRQNTRYSRSYQDQRTIYQYGLDSDNRTVGRFAYIGHEKVKNALVDNQLQAKWNVGRFEHTSLAGIDLQHAMTDQLGGGNLASPLDVYDPVYHQDYSGIVPEYDLDQKQTLNQAGVYMQEQLKFDDHWVLNVGGRKDWTRKENDNQINNTDTKQRDHAFTWRTGAMYLADNGLSPYLSYSESFIPTVGSTDRSGGVFEPETGKQYEVGVKFQPPGSESFVTVSLFDLTRQNVLTPDPVNNRFSIQTGELESKGIELEAKATVNDSLDIIANYNYSHVEITKSTAGDEGNRPANTPAVLASLWAQYTLHQGPLDGLGIGGGVRYVGASYVDNEHSDTIPSYTLLDGTITYDLSRITSSLKGVQVALNASNLTDEKYVSQCGYTGDSCKYGYRRNVTGSVTYNW
jgi:iron complex outermembrane receptor protein